VIGITQIWLIDFEFQAPKGERPRPLCLSARELNSGRVVSLWRHEMQAMPQAPFGTGPDSLVVGYYVSAELGCFLALGWKFPVNVLDLFAEHRVATNGLPSLCGNGLLGALAYRGIAGMDSARKESMRGLVIDNTSWTAGERQAIQNYCGEDTAALGQLFHAMAPSIDWPRALLRGRYMAAAAKMEWVGVPLDAALYKTTGTELGSTKN
jgi:DNA polymerase-1